MMVTESACLHTLMWTHALFFGANCAATGTSCQLTCFRHWSMSSPLWVGLPIAGGSPASSSQSPVRNLWPKCPYTCNPRYSQSQGTCNASKWELSAAATALVLLLLSQAGTFTTYRQVHSVLP